MLRAHEYLFAVVFWFLLLGAVGGLLYCLAANLARRHEKVGDGYAGAARRLHNILMWPSARLLALGFALGGRPGKRAGKLAHGIRPYPGYKQGGDCRVGLRRAAL